MIFATAAEYNPFHNGHAYHISQIKKLGADGIIAVMSGSFVQRGEPAVMSKFERAKCAVRNGVDLVLELPVSFSVGSAERFAAGCVRIAEATGVVSKFCFGSESANVPTFEKTVETLETPEFSSVLKEELSEGKTFAAARANALKELGAFAPEKPNDILAVEYIKELKRLKSKIVPVAIKRVGDYHGGSTGFASASEIRRKIDGGVLPKEDLPKETSETLEKLLLQGKAPAKIENLERMLIGFFRNAEAEELKEYYAVTEGAENRIIAAANSDLDRRFLRKSKDKTVHHGNCSPHDNRAVSRHKKSRADDTVFACACVQRTRSGNNEKYQKKFGFAADNELYARTCRSSRICEADRT